MKDDIDPEAAQAVLWFFDRTAGIEPGSFVASLLETMSHADLTNRATLVAAFPKWGVPFLVAKSARNGIAELRAIAQGVAA